MSGVLTVLFVFPFLSAIGLIGISSIWQKHLKWLAFALSLVPLCLLIFQHQSLIGESINYPWLRTLSIHFYLSVDSLSLFFLFLVNLIIPFSLIAISEHKERNSSLFYGLILFLQGLLVGFFTARDLAAFMIFWEAILLPLYFIINGWGGELRQQASLKFLIYMIAGSTLMVFAVLALFFASGQLIGEATFNLDELAVVSSAVPYATALFGIFLLAFAVKTPMFPFHGWLPDVYYQAPTSGSILLAAILSKAGIYGILRIGMELFSPQLQEWSPLLLSLAIIGVFYGGLAAWTQKDFKRLISYSSLSHVNFILAGLFAWNQMSQSGAILQSLNHSLTITGLFLVASWLTERIGSTRLDRASGLAAYFPILCWTTLVFVLASVALPGTNNFVGELLILMGLFLQNEWAGSFLAITLVLSAMYMLRWMQQIYFESPGPVQSSWTDIKAKELMIALPLILLIVWIGIYPTPFFNLFQPNNPSAASIAKLESIP